MLLHGRIVASIYDDLSHTETFSYLLIYLFAKVV